MIFFFKNCQKGTFVENSAAAIPCEERQRARSPFWKSVQNRTLLFWEECPVERTRVNERNRRCSDLSCCGWHGFLFAERAEVPALSWSDQARLVRCLSCLFDAANATRITSGLRGFNYSGSSAEQAFEPLRGTSDKTAVTQAQVLNSRKLSVIYLSGLCSTASRDAQWLLPREPRKNVAGFARPSTEAVKGYWKVLNHWFPAILTRGCFKLPPPVMVVIHSDFRSGHTPSDLRHR